MPTKITQKTATGNSSEIVLAVEGEMHLEDAVVIERLVRNELSGKAVRIDLADLDFLDSESGAVLRRIADEHSVKLDGIEIFLQAAIDSAERTG